MIIAVDFDGCLCKHAFPEIGAANEDVIQVLIQARTDGNKLILWTCREGKKLVEAVQWAQVHGLYFDAVNENVPELKNQDFAIRKVYADCYLDDRNMNMKEMIAYLKGKV